MDKARILRNAFRKKDLVRIAGAHDGLSAKLVDNNGFDGIWASGLEISTSFCVPDANILTMSQYLERATEMNQITSIPVIADCDTGYGNSNNVIHMIKMYESAGIAGVCIEDKLFPKTNSLLSGGRQEIASIAEFVGKIMAAKNTQSSKDFMVIARIEALIAGWGYGEAIKRAEAYSEAGADAILIHSKAKDPHEIKEFCRRWKNHRVPIVIVPTNYPMITEKEMKKMDVKMVIYANHGIRASIKAMNNTYREIRKTGGIASVTGKIASMQEIFDIQGIPKMKEEEEKYLKGKKEPINAVILAAGKPNNQESLMPLLSDIPLAMLDIKGKSLLQRDVEIFSESGIHDVNVVVGYKKEKIDIEMINKIDNDEYKSSHVLKSLFKAEHVMNGRTLVCFADILLDAVIIDQLLKRDDDIVLVVDSTFKKINSRNKKLDIVKTRYKTSMKNRSLNLKTNQVTHIGNDMAESKADCEFIGMMLFSRKGIECLKKEYHIAEKKYKSKKFHSASKFNHADITDLLSEMINKEYKIGVMEVSSGWMEIHTFENYKTACKVVK